MPFISSTILMPFSRLPAPWTTSPRRKTPASARPWPHMEPKRFSPDRNCSSSSESACFRTPPIGNWAGSKKPSFVIQGNFPSSFLGSIDHSPRTRKVSPVAVVAIVLGAESLFQTCQCLTGRTWREQRYRRPQHILNFLPLPHGQGSFRPTFCFLLG